MIKAIKIVVILLCLPLLVLGLKSMFDPMGMIEKLGVEPLDANGLNTIRGHIGGTLLTAAAMMAIGLWRKNTTWFLAVAVFMILVAFGRLVGFVMDGVDTASVPPFVIELVITGVMFAAHRKLAPKK